MERGAEDALRTLHSVFFPEIHAAIDWARGIEFLDKELRAITRGSKAKHRHADQLVKVYLKSGEERWLLVHVEVQSQVDKDFPVRMFIYHYRGFDLYQVEVVSLAILADTNPVWRPDRFEYANFGCALQLRYPIVKLDEWRGRWAELEKSTNPFAFVVMAFLKTQETTDDAKKRHDVKLELTRSLYRRGLTKDEIDAIFNIVDRFMVLPDNYDRLLEDELVTIEEEDEMPFESTLERIYRKRGIEIGLQKGRREGIRTARELVVEAMAERFGKVPPKIVRAVGKVNDADELKKLLRWSLNATSLNSFPLGK